jgi:hypothetical protein
MNDLKEQITVRYEMHRYKKIGETQSGLKFANMFSRHFVFVVSSVDELLMFWQKLHEEVVQEYREFSEESFLEWNFYTVFIIREHDLSNEQKARLLEIEQDRSYSRKYVRTAEEIKELPPGIISSDELGAKEDMTENITQQWRDVLGGKLYDVIITGPKNAVEKRLRRKAETLP